MSAYGTSHPPCDYCGQTHVGTCPRVKAFHYYENEGLKAVEFHAPPVAERPATAHGTVEAALADAVAFNGPDGGVVVIDDELRLSAIAQITRMRAALQPFAKFYEAHKAAGGSDAFLRMGTGNGLVPVFIETEDFRAAVDALKMSEHDVVTSGILTPDEVRATLTGKGGA